MYRNRSVLTGFAVAATIAMSGCGPQPSAEKSTTSPAPVASVASATETAVAAAGTTAPTKDVATAKACAELKKDIKENAAQIAEVQKIGPPAGHIAVSAQWAAGATAVIAHSIGAGDAVSAAADRVQKEMSALGDEYNKSARGKPSQKKLDAAIKNLTAACAAA